MLLEILLELDFLLDEELFTLELFLLLEILLELDFLLDDELLMLELFTLLLIELLDLTIPRCFLLDDVAAFVETDDEVFFAEATELVVAVAFLLDTTDELFALLELFLLLATDELFTLLDELLILELFLLLLKILLELDFLLDELFTLELFLLLDETLLELDFFDDELFTLELMIVMMPLSLKLVKHYRLQLVITSCIHLGQVLLGLE